MYKDITEAKFQSLKGRLDTLVLGIESSCDETAAAVVRGGREVLSSVISSQVDIHQRFGGVVPEVASRNHALSINNVVEMALSQANVTLDDIDVIGVTYGAGLLGALLVGVSAAKGYSFAKNIPLVKVNHIQAHIAANYIEHHELKPPFYAVVASGGHTCLVDVLGYNEFVLDGGTLDDAIGEAFDKTARLLSLPYPGGPSIERAAENGTANINFFKERRPPKSDLTLSYSGLKTAVINYVHNLKQKNEEIPVSDICASFSFEAVKILADSVQIAMKKSKRNTLVLAGGVAANSLLKKTLHLNALKGGYKLYCPEPKHCTDNAIMVATQCYFSAFEGKNLADLTLNAVSNLSVTGGHF